MWSKFGLRSRLFISYMVLLLISFGVLAGTLLILLGSSPAPPLPTYEQLGAMLPGLREEIDVAGVLFQLRNVEEGFDAFAESRNVRVIWVRQHDSDTTTVVYDSADNFAQGDTIGVNVDQRYSSPRLQQLFPGTRVIFGQFDDVNAGEWLFTGVTLPPRRGVTSVILLAEPRPTATLQSVLSNFSSSLLPPLLQSLALGGIISFVLAFVISRSIAKPLRELARGAASVAKGAHDSQVLETGPREVRAVASAFNQMSSEVRRTQQSQREFLANVSHDLKTPLTSIQGYSQAIMDGATDDPAYAARIIHDEAGRLNRMVVQLTDLARLQAGRLSMKMTGLDIAEMVDVIGQRLAVVAAKKQIALHVEAKPLPTIAGDGDRLVQVLTNLISNAIKYTPPGGTVWVKTDLRNGGVEIRVRDTGMGIPTKDLPRVFDRFYQVDKSRGPQRGTGLGLAITKEIVNAHGGSIDVDSPGPDKGTTFTVWLPSPQLSTVVRQRIAL